MIRILLYFLLFSLLVALLPFLLSFTQFYTWLAAGFWYMYLFFALLTCLVLIVVILGQQKDVSMGAPFFLGATTIKLLACMVFALIYIEKMHVKPTVFVLSFFYLYLLNTAFEIYALLTNLRVQNKK